MTIQIPLTTAEDIIGAVDAVFQKPDGITPQVLEEFLDTTPTNAKNALIMATQLNLIKEDKNIFFQNENILASYLILCNFSQKAAILRIVLEKYDPYRKFKQRIQDNVSIQDAGRQVKALFNIPEDRSDITSTLISLGTFTESLNVEGGGRYTINTDVHMPYLDILEISIGSSDAIELHLRNELTPVVFDWLNHHDIVEQLINAYGRLSLVSEDQKAPIVHAANAVEAFLNQYADSIGINVKNKFGINAKIDEIENQGSINPKHKNMFKYLGHIRNAADHGPDSLINQTWDISEQTSILYVQTSIRAIRSLYLFQKSRYIL